jgi:peptidoglycan-associated lipoprotein
MIRRTRSRTLAVVVLFGASALLAGCPKQPAPESQTGPAGQTGPGGQTVPGGPGGPGGVSGGGAARAGGPGAGAVPGSVGARGTGSPGGQGPTGPGRAAVTGTTIPALPPPREFVETPALRDITFDLDRYEIRPQDRAVLDGNAQWLKANAGALVLIEGHADERGTDEYNLALGERRARTVRDYLVSAGVDVSRITVVSYGEERPLCTERTEACWARNRRAHFLVKP